MYLKGLRVTDQLSKAQVARMLLTNQETVLAPFGRAPGFSKTKSLRRAFAIEAESIRSQNEKLFLLNGSRLVGLVSATSSLWDTEHFGIKTCKVTNLIFGDGLTLADRASFVRTFFKLLRGKGFRLVILRLPFVDTRAINSVISVGGKVYDVLVSFCGDSTTPKHVRAVRNSRVVRAGIGDAAFVKGLSRTSFRKGHLHADPRLDRALADEVYSKIAESQLADGSWFVMKAVVGDIPAGFITYRIEKHSEGYRYCQISLLAVVPRFSRKGIGSMLVADAVKFAARAKVRDVIVSTKASNYGAVRLYERSGFLTVSSSASLHVWLDERTET